MDLFANHPLFPQGLRILAVDHDVGALCTIQDICTDLYYQVITCCTVSDAWNYLLNQNFDIILIEARMPTSNDTTFDFVGQITSLFKLPVIVMSLDHSVSTVMKSIAKGACAYWSKPLDQNQFKNMWQHVVRNTLSQSQLPIERKALSESESHELPQTLEVKGHKKRGREVVDVPKQPLAKKNRLSWTPELHEQFLLAVNQLGVNNAVLKEILKRMNCPGLTSGHVSSHLQKYRMYLKGEIRKSKLSGGSDFHGHDKICKQQQHSTETDESDILIDLSDLLPHSDFHGHDEICKQQQNQTESDESDILIDLSDLLPHNGFHGHDEICKQQQNRTETDESDIFFDLCDLLPHNDFHGHDEICNEQQHWTESDESDIFIDLCDLFPDNIMS